MFVSAHALNRLAERLGPTEAALIADLLDQRDGERGTIAYVLATLPAKATAPDGSNGEALVAVAVEATVETVYFRRAGQGLTAADFGARKLVDLRRGKLVVEDTDDEPDDPTRQEARDERVRNGRKMRVTGRSTFLLRDLSREPQRRRQRQGKRGAR